MDMMRIPLATVLFVGSVGLLYALSKPEQIALFAGMDSVTTSIIAVASIVCLVYSFVLYSNIQIAK